MSNTRPFSNVGLDRGHGYSLVEKEPVITAEAIRGLAAEPSWAAEGQDLRHILIEALAQYVASTNNKILKKEGRKRAETLAVLINQLASAEGDDLNDLQLAARLLRYMRIEDNRDNKPSGPFGTSKDMRAAVMAKICEFMQVPRDEIEAVKDIGLAQNRQYMVRAAGHGAGPGVAVSLLDEDAIRQKVSLQLVAKKMKSKSEDRELSVFVQDLFKTINQYQESTRSKGCCMFGRVKPWKQKGFDRANTLKDLISDMVKIENLSDDQIRSELREYATFKKHIGLFDSSKQLRSMMLGVLTNQPRQEDRQQVDL